VDLLVHFQKRICESVIKGNSPPLVYTLKTNQTTFTLPTPKMNTNRDLITALQSRTLTSLLQDNKDAPYIFEKTASILTTARLLPGLEGVTEVSMKNSNKGFANITDFRRDFLNVKIKDSNAAGKSDCTFRIGTRTFITTAKYREGDAVDISKDMDALSTLRRREEFKDAENVVWVKDRDIWIAAHKRAHSKSMYPIKYEYVYDVKMFDAQVLELRKVLEHYNGSIDDFAIKYLPYLKVRMTPRFHQLLGQRLFKPGVFLFAMKCRAGKTISAGNNIIQQGFKTVLYITPVPSETKNSAIDTFRRYIDFDDYDIINLEAGAMIPYPLTKPTIFVTSKQYLDKHHMDDNLKRIHFDAMYHDEIHWAGLTDKNNEMRRNLIRENTSLILMSGTPDRARVDFGIDESHVFYWNLEDEAACKRGDIAYLNRTFGETNVQAALVSAYGPTDHAAKLIETYKEMPQLRQIIYKLTDDYLKNFSICTEKDNKSFDMQELFRMENGALVHRDLVLKFLKSYFGTGDGQVMVSTMDTIRKLNTRIGQVGSDYYTGGGGATQLWFLSEHVQGGSVDLLSGALKKIIDEHFPEYKTIIVNSSAKLDTREGMEKFVKEQEAIAIREKKDGLIILLGRMMAMGVSLPRADIVCMFNNLSKIDLYTQMSMRCLTQDTGKTTGVVVDFNQKRVLEASMALIPRCTGTGHEIIKRMVEVVAFGSNSFETKDVTHLVEDFHSIWKAQSFDKVKVLSARLTNFAGSVTITSEEQKEIMKASWTRSNQTAQTLRQELLDVSERVPDAESVESEPKQPKETKVEPEKLDDVIPNFSHEVFTTIPPYVAFLTYADKSEEFISHLLKKIRDSPLLNEMFRDQCGSWWKGTKNMNFIDLLINIFGRCDSKASRGISSIISALKSEMESLIDDMRATLTFLNSILEPKDSEKERLGEVFTPDWFADDSMLGSYPTSIWDDPTEKFYDPAAGSGVFPVCIYYRLMDSVGMKKAFPNATKRKQHILTKMLFMSEIGSKNVGILKHIFGGIANIYHGDSLKLDVKEQWAIDLKDVNVVGNPPYNTSREHSTTASALYPKFIEKYIHTCKTLLFVIPSRWFSGGSGVKEFRKMMLSRKDLRFIHTIEDASTVFGPKVSIEGGINYFMKDASYHGDCNMDGKLMDLSAHNILVDSKYNELITKMKVYPSISSLYKGNPYSIPSNDKRVTDTATESTLVCFMSKQKGFEKHIEKGFIKTDYGYWKVITAEANGNSKKFGNTFIGSPTSVHSESYRSFQVRSEDEAKSLVSFMKTDLANKLMGLRKASQHICADTCSWVPLPPLDREWTNETVQTYFKLTEDEIALCKTDS